MKIINYQDLSKPKNFSPNFISNLKRPTRASKRDVLELAFLRYSKTKDFRIGGLVRWHEEHPNIKVHIPRYSLLPPRYRQFVIDINEHIPSIIHHAMPEIENKENKEIERRKKREIKNREIENRVENKENRENKRREKREIENRKNREIENRKNRKTREIENRVDCKKVLFHGCCIFSLWMIFFTIIIFSIICYYYHTSIQESLGKSFQDICRTLSKVFIRVLSM